MKNEDGLLDDLAPKRKRVVKKKRFYSNKGVTAEVAARRQAAAEAAQENPLPRLQKDAILMKFGVNVAVIERDICMPKWKGEQIRQRSERETGVVWSSMMQEWFKATKNLVKPSRQRSSGRVYTASTTSGIARNAVAVPRGQSFTRPNAPYSPNNPNSRRSHPRPQSLNRPS